MIALVATDPDRDLTEDVELGFDEEEKPRVSATLIIIPPPCKWEPATGFDQNARLTKSQ